MPLTPAAALVARLTAADAPPFALLRRRRFGGTGGDPAAPGGASPDAGALGASSGPGTLAASSGPGTLGGASSGTVEVLLGPVTEEAELSGIALPDGVPAGGPAADVLALVPFRQIRERGFQVRDDGAPLLVLRPREAFEIPASELAAALPGHPVRVRDGAFDLDDAAYRRTVERVLAEEIGRGAGSNFVVRRSFEGVIDGFAARDALALFGRLLRAERGAYWTFLVHTGQRTLVGASPEAHLRMSGGTVVMNPISGTYRYPPEGPTADGLLAFLDDPKEAEELTMVVDEELKMMAAVCDLGGVVVGPRLKEMARLAHTEYELRGRSTLDVREVLRETMFAATVTGSPVRNACRVLERHERSGRGYYAGTLALIGRDAGGERTVDAPILIRTAEIDGAGRLRVGVGATLVRHSDPRAECAETHAKAAGVLTALGVLTAPAGPAADAPRLADDPRVRAALDARRARLSPFWLRMRPADPRPAADRPVLLVDAEDTFTAMLAHLLRAEGQRVAVVGRDDPALREAALTHPGPVVLGPGPGDPRDVADPGMRRLRSLTAELVAEHREGLLGVCLGHELIAAELGLAIVRRELPFQGAQERIDLFGRPETVGFYNTFTAVCDEALEEELAMHRIEVSRDPLSGAVHALRGPGFAGVQFHPESVLTMNGPAIAAELLAAVTVA